MPPCCRFSTKSIWLEQFLQRVTQGTFLPNYLAITQADNGGKGFLKFGYFSHFLMPQQPKFYTEWKSLNNFERGPTKEHSCEVKLKLVYWNGRSCHL